jgi:hypothetical protein
MLRMPIFPAGMVPVASFRTAISQNDRVAGCFRTVAPPEFRPLLNPALNKVPGSGNLFTREAHGVAGGWLAAQLARADSLYTSLSRSLI